MGQIGSLWYNIGAKTAEFQKALTDSKSKLMQFKTGLGDVTRSLTGFDLSTATSVAGIGLLVNEYRKAIDETMLYAQQVRTLSRDIGATPQDVSKLIQAADDTQVSFESLKTAMVMANKQGVDVTIEGMQKLADKYISIQDPLDRTRFLTDTFGRSGEQLGALMALGADGIKKAGDEAERYGRILTEQDIQATEDFRIAADGLGDAMLKMKDSIALDVIPALTDMLNVITPVINAYNDFKDLIDKIPTALKPLVMQFDMLLNPIKLLTGPLYYLIDGFKELFKITGGKTELPAVPSTAGQTSRGSVYTNPDGTAKTNRGSIYDTNANGASGLNMVVPAGYPNDTFKIGASTGEQVSIGKNANQGNDQMLQEIQGMRRELNRLPLALRDAYLFAVKNA
jgi:hypothetical protein